jgi:iron complex transport system substrate-binding protein
MTFFSRARIGLVLVAATLALSSCGSDEESGGSTPATGGGPFPITVEHKFGTTTVPSKPRRIAVVGLTEQDTVIALGFKPIATTEWYGKQPYAVWPWAEEALGDAKPTVLTNTDGFQFEKIATLRPDLIIGTNAGMQRADYKKLSAIAPTIAGAKGSTDYFSPWDQQTELIAKSLGKEAEGRKLVQGIKDQYAAAAAEHPEFKDKTITFSQNGFYAGSIYVYPDGLNTEVLTYLGFSINPKVTARVEKPGEQVPISAELIDVLDADVILFATEAPSDIPALEKVPTFRTLDAVAGHRAVFTDGVLAGAIYFISPLSLPYVLDRLTPQLEAAVAGKAPRRIVE